MIVDGAPSSDSAPVACTVSASLGAATLAGQQASYGNDMATPPAPAYYGLAGALNADATPDLLSIELYKFMGGAFAAGFPTSSTTIQLTGAETAYDSCAACALIVADYAQGAMPQVYLANAGSMTLTSVSTTSMAGSLSNVTFRHVDIADQTYATTDNADGCTSTLTSVSFTAVPMAPMAPMRVAPNGTHADRQTWQLTLRK